MRLYKQRRSQCVGLLGRGDPVGCGDPTGCDGPTRSGDLMVCRQINSDEHMCCCDTMRFGNIMVCDESSDLVQYAATTLRTAAA